jgi:phage I-like protein
VFYSDEQGEINCILRAALTNTPNLQLPALNCERSSFEQSSDEQPENINMEDCMDKILCAALGLAETATVNDALAVIEKLKTAQNTAQSIDLNAAQLKKEAEAAVDEAVKAGKIPPALKDTYINMCATQAGLEQFKDIAAKTPAIIDGKPQAPTGTLPASSVSLNSEDAAFAKAAGYSVEEWQKIKEAGK